MAYKFKYLKKQGYDPYQYAKDYFFDEKAGRKAVTFFKEQLTLTKGKWKGQPFKPFGWAEDVIMAIFGWKHKKTKKRRYDTAFIYVPRKNAKSELVAGIADCEFFTADEPDNEIYVGARDRGQASTLHTMCSKMVTQNEELDKEATIFKTTKEIKANWDDSVIQAVSSDALGQHSSSPGMVIIDELHAQRNGLLIEALTTGMGARSQPLTIYITTADVEGESICNDELDYAREVQENPRINPNYLPVIYETLPDEDWTDEKVWAKANPSYPVTPNPTFLRKRFQEAQKSMRKKLSFKRLFLNMKTSTLEGWLDMEAWRIGNEIFEEEEMVGKECYVSWDLASKTDLSALALFFPESGRLIMRFYCPEKAIKADKSGYYREWLEEGELKVSGESITDYRYIRADIEEFSKKFELKRLGFDPHNANNLINELEEVFSQKLEDDEEFMLEFTQTYTNYCDPCKEFEAMVIDGTLKHNSRILDWMAANVTVREGPSGDLMPQKPKRKSTKKIDGITAAIMAVGLWLRDKGDDDDDEIRVHNLEDYLEE